MYFYSAFGLNISSEWPIFQLDKTEQPYAQGLELDVAIEFGDVAEFGYQLDQPPVDQVAAKNEGSICLHVDGVGKFVMLNGRRIVVQLTSNCEMQTVNLYVLGTCLGTILHQRELLPLHGNAVDIDGRATVVVGHSGAGKSTLASEFFRLGYSLLADDVCAIGPQELSAQRQAPLIKSQSITSSTGAVPFVYPSYPYLKLWQEAIDRLSTNDKDLVEINSQNQKFYLPIENQFCSKALPLGTIYLMSKQDIPETRIQEVKGVEKLLRLRQYIYRVSFLRKMSPGAPALERILSNLSQTRIYQIRRPVQGMHVESIAQMIIAQEHSHSNSIDEPSSKGRVI